jgi:hypothetical protein
MSAKRFEVCLKKAVTTPGYAGSQTLGGVSSGNTPYVSTEHRYLTIITETFQDAVSIAKAQLAKDESISGVHEIEGEMIIDPACVSGKN